MPQREISIYNGVEIKILSLLQLKKRYFQLNLSKAQKIKPLTLKTGSDHEENNFSPNLIRLVLTQLRTNKMNVKQIFKKNDMTLYRLAETKSQSKAFVLI